MLPVKISKNNKLLRKLIERIEEKLFVILELKIIRI